MRRIIHFILMMAALLMAPVAARCACTMIVGSPTDNSTRESVEMTIPLVCTCDGSGGAIESTPITRYDGLGGAQLVEVEVVPGETCAAVAATITNSRGTVVWDVDPIDTTQGRVYGGHTEIGIFPKWDTAWSFSSADLGSNGSVTFYLKLSK